MNIKNASYWEYKTWFHNIDFAVIGSGIVGLNCALALRKKHPRSKIVIFERGMLPSGASTKNAGFACFGSLSEILSDLQNHSEQEVIGLVQARIRGLELLRKTLGDVTLDFQLNGGFELFRSSENTLFETCLNKRAYVNKLLHPVFEADVFSEETNTFQFKNIQSTIIRNRFEGQIDTGKMVSGLLQKASEAQIHILNNAEITQLHDSGSKVNFQLNNSEELTAKQVCIATNGFAKQLLHENVQPARAQVLITKPIKNLAIKGTFHLEEGYYYFRNIDDRILLGGGRNLDIKGEETTVMKVTNLIQNKLEELLHTTILPETAFEIERRWSGIMGVGSKKKPIVKQLSEHVFCGVRLGGMGVAIGSTIGADLANLIPINTN
ncbi:NAD(P)/FAD-dependent oxidoreductase [Cochleicola gelatinilyticus]|uniref:FAD-dependent oxidoreductase n=1 Tax=Cochleicola gelatinilyticus TaxID=1763537 RepID=A0A167J2Y9_9FLAO|nr:FAD-dependent oxidoreductase [Cochleicola gelatinilyticus]OAB80281.1 FAD-dependent oxidoreductase [Cochleicola gelatinilyticus]